MYINLQKLKKEFEYIINTNNKKKILNCAKILIDNNEKITIKKDCILFILNNCKNNTLLELNNYLLWFFFKYFIFKLTLKLFLK